MPPDCAAAAPHAVSLGPVRSQLAGPRLSEVPHARAAHPSHPHSNTLCRRCPLLRTVYFAHFSSYDSTKSKGAPVVAVQEPPCPVLNASGALHHLRLSSSAPLRDYPTSLLCSLVALLPYCTYTLYRQGKGRSSRRCRGRFTPSDPTSCGWDPTSCRWDPTGCRWDPTGCRWDPTGVWERRDSPFSGVPCFLPDVTTRPQTMPPTPNTDHSPFIPTMRHAIT